MPTDYKKRMEQWIRESTKKMIEEKIKPIMKKLKHLRATFLQYAQERSIAGAWTEELKEDFEIIEALELDLNIRKRLLTGDMLLCNKLYKKYRVIYD
jgi:O-succinylbenzoate synthase